MAILQMKAHGEHPSSSAFKGVSQQEAEKMSHEGLKSSVQSGQRLKDIERRMGGRR